MYQEWTCGSGVKHKALIPEHIAKFVRIIGEDDTASLLLNFGGAASYFAARPEKVGALREILSVEKIQLLAEHFGGRVERIPLGNAFIARHLRSKGMSIQDIARKLHVSDVSVRDILRNTKRGAKDTCDPPKKVRR